MATTKRPEVTRQSSSKLTASKSPTYEALSALNQHFEDVLENLGRLRKLCLLDTRFRRESLEACWATIEETRAWANFEIVEILHEREERDRARWGRIRCRWESKLEDPQDVLIKPMQLRRKSPVNKPGRG